MSLTPNPVSCRSGSDANMMLSSQDLFGRQRPTCASCPDWVQTMILKNIRETIKAKMQQEHRVREDRREGFTDDWAAVAAEVQSKISSQGPTRATPQIQSQLLASWESGPWRAPRVTNSIHKKLSRPLISARWPDWPPHARLHGFRVKLPATWVSGPWRPHRVTNSIYKKRSRLSISARQQRDF